MEYDSDLALGMSSYMNVLHANNQQISDQCHKERKGFVILFLS